MLCVQDQLQHQGDSLALLVLSCCVFWEIPLSPRAITAVDFVKATLRVSGLLRPRSSVSNSSPVGAVPITLVLLASPLDRANTVVVLPATGFVHWTAFASSCARITGCCFGPRFTWLTSQLFLSALLLFLLAALHSLASHTPASGARDLRMAPACTLLASTVWVGLCFEAQAKEQETER